MGTFQQKLSTLESVKAYLNDPMKRQPPRTIQDKKKSQNNSSFFLAPGDRLPLLLLLAYASQELLNGGHTSDVMGDQWVMVTILNVLSIFLFLFKKDLIRNNGISQVMQNPVILFLGGILVIAGISIFVSVNKTEALVVYARLANMVIMCFVIALLMWGRMHLFRWLAAALSVLLLVQSLQVLSQFFTGINSGETLTALIYNLKLNAANKNILAAMLVFKTSLAIYCAYSSRSVGARIFFSIILLPAALAIFIINARAAYLGLSFAAFSFLLLAILDNRKELLRSSVWQRILMPVLALVLAYVFSGIIISNAVKQSGQDTPYGTVAERLGTIEFSATGSNARILQWQAAYDYIKKHPLLGSGIGNWKLASIPYERPFVNDLLVAYHVHNDFLEFTAETGLLGGLFYLSVFVLILFTAIRTLLRSSDPLQKGLAILLTSSLLAYGTDAVFNFPMERPVMQFYFAVLIALAVGLSVKGKVDRAVDPGVRNIVLGALLVLLLPLGYVILQTSRSLVVQAKVNKDILTSDPQTAWEEIENAFPRIPNMNAYTFPIDQVKAMYLIRDKKYDEAMNYVRRSENVNPYLTLTEYLKAKIFNEKGQMDSAYFYARKAFNSKPRAKSHYELLVGILLQRKDTTELTRIFREYIQYRNEADAWNNYAVNMISLNSTKEKMLTLIDSALKVFPADTSLVKTKNILQTNSRDIEFYNTFQQAMKFFTGRQFENAIREFTKADEIKPGQYVNLENIGLCYYSLNNFKEAIIWFDKVIASHLSTDGKSEFFKGASLIGLGKKELACPLFRIAQSKAYPEAGQLIDRYCR